MDSKVVKPLWIRITACGFGSVVVTSLAIGGLSFYRQYEAGEEKVAHELSNDIGAIQADIAGQRRTATGVALAIAGEPEIGEFLVQKSREEIVRRYSRNIASLKADADVHLVTFTDATGMAVARIHDPATFGDNVLTRRRTVAETVKTGRLTAGIEPGRMFLAMFATAPVIQGGKTVGVVDIGTALTNEYFLRLSKAQDANIAIHLLKGDRFEIQNSTFPTKPVLTDAELRTILDGGSLRRTVSSDEQSFIAGGVPISDFSGQKIGVMEVASNVTAVANARSTALWSTGLATLTVAALVLVGFLLFARSLAATIGRLTASMGQLAAGDLQTEISGQDRRDEIGAMARAVQVFKAAGIQHGRLSDEAGDMRRNADEERTKTEAARERSAGEQAFVVSAIGDGLVRLAEGDLTREISDTFPAEYRKLQDDFNAAIRQLQGTMSSVIGSAGGIQSGAGEISQAAQDLSRRTEQQAAALEETAAALDEITATVRRTAEGASQARDAVSGARSEAERSGEVVQGAVGAMAAIERSSTEISQIIGVIDEIAFQTNLLALNAGVEAARAGEAGRGFAVVASEVRALAQRSAEAAKEIKTLIQASSAQVKSGVDLVGEAGRALARIVTQVQGVSGVVGEIAASAQEQATGLSQVNTAVNQMDQMTQQNAAMVEETTAASHSLAQEAEQLAKLIARFKVGTHTGGTLKAAVRKPAAAAPRASSRAASRPASHGNLALKAAPAEAGWEEF